MGLAARSFQERAYHLRPFAPKVELLTGQGSHIRYVPAQVAEAMVTGGSAAPAPTPGRIKAITLTQAASTSAVRTGPPSEGKAMGVIGLA